MAKKMKFERKNAREARKGIDPNQPPPSPQESAAMAASGVDLNRGSSNLDQLTPEGHEQLKETGEKLAAKGGLDKIHSSASTRAMESAQEVAAADPSAPPISSDSNLESWAQGNLEGQPEKAVKEQIRDLIRKNPRTVIPGQGSLTTRPGESFDQYKSRALPAIRGLMQELAQDPSAKIGVPIHSSVIKLTKAWLANGAPDDLSINPYQMDKESEAPGTVARLFPSPEGEWEVKDVDLDDKKPLQSGIFLIRHGATPFNVPGQQEKGSAAQDALSQIAKYSKTISPSNFGRIRSVGQNAVDAGHLTHDEVSDAIDSNLPSTEDAANLPNHQLLAITAAASPKKKEDYRPIIQRNFGDANLSPELAKHIRDILPPRGDEGMLPT